jgi:general secretion pathway protein A
VYKQFYQLRRNPFEITPDPSFLFPTKRHNEALAALYYGVRRHKGFVVMTGEVGTGKTLLVRCLLELLRRAEVGFAYIFNPRLSPLEFLRYIGRDLGLVVTGKAKDELLLDLGAYLIDRHRKKLTTVLVVDEAHHLSADVLEEIRLLTNLETSQEKLLQILLVGQPELDEKLDSTGLRQLKQRVSLRCHLEPLAPQETAEYVRRRLQVAGASEANAGEIFPEPSLSQIHRHSRGIPRLINTVCENALINGYARQLNRIPPEIIEEVATDLRLSVVHPTRPARDENREEVQKALRMLLSLQQYLQSSRLQEEETLVGTTRAARVRDDEPVI